VRAWTESARRRHERVVVGDADRADEVQSDAFEARQHDCDAVHGLDNASSPSLPKPVSPHHPLEEE
jgi:hypothetical protein